MKADPRVDAYIQKAPSFAQPVLAEVRKRVQKAVPDAVETIKWNVPFYELNGKLLASMAAFKKHAKIGVWRDAKPDMLDVTSVSELPSAVEHTRLLKEAAEHTRGIGAGKIAKKTVAQKKAPAKTAITKKKVAKKKVAKK